MAQGLLLSPGALPPPPPAPEEKKQWEDKLGVRLMCKDCRLDPPNLYEDHASGDLICADCGLVLQARCVDTSSEWRTFANDDQGNDDPSRVGDGPNLLLNGSQLHTSIAYGDGGMRSKDLNRAQNRSTLDKGNKALLLAYKQISSLGDTWQVPSIVTDTAKLVYKSIDESRLFKGKNVEAVCASVLFFACRKHNISRTFREAMDLTRVSKKEIGRTFKQVKHFIDHHQMAEHDNKVTMLSNGALTMASEDHNTGAGSKDATELCPRFCSNLRLDQQTTNVVSGLVENIKEDGVLDGRSPLSLVAACIYMACQLMGVERSPKEIGKVVNVSDSTIRGAYKFIWKTRYRVVTEDLIQKGADLNKLVDLRSQEEKASDAQKELTAA